MFTEEQMQVTNTRDHQMSMLNSSRDWSTYTRWTTYSSCRWMLTSARRLVLGETGSHIHAERWVLGERWKCKKITRWVFKHLKHTPKTLSTIKFEGGGTTPLISKQIGMFVFWVEDQLSLRFRVCDSIKGFQRIREVCSVLLFSALHCTDLQFET